MKEFLQSEKFQRVLYFVFIGFLIFFSVKIILDIKRGNPFDFENLMWLLFSFFNILTYRKKYINENVVSEKATKKIMKLVGSAPLKDLVADTSDIVEKICIETALKMTKNNRVATAEMLNLSRQSLYVKLRKYNIL